MHETTRPLPSSTSRFSRCATFLLLALVVAIDAPSHAADAAPPTENPLRTADAATRAAAITKAWTTFQRSCRPCHGSLGAGDGPYAMAFPQRAADLRRPSREIATDAVRFARIRDGAAALGDRAWESSMPAFGDDLDASEIWGLVALLEDLGKEGSGLAPDASGADVYATRCAVCHGAAGAGDGPLAAELLPPPRNFLHGAYRVRSTEYGEAPLDSDLIGAIAHGLGSTSMGRFLTLGAERLENLAAHLMSFTPKLFANTPRTLTGSAVPPGATLQLAARGRTVYEEAKCAECHGAAGRGDGPAAATLKDDEGHPSIATDLTQRWRFKLGSGANDVFRTLTAGLNGTPMKSYTDLSSDDRWALAHYVDRIGRTRPRGVGTVQTAVVTDELPLDPDHAFWKTVLRTELPMSPQVEVPPYWTAPAIDLVEIAAVVHGDQLGVLLVWDDPSRSIQNDDTRASSIAEAIARYGAWKLPDAVALEFPSAPDPKATLPPSLLGDEKRPVRRWYWSAERYARGETDALLQTIAGPRATPVTAGDGAPVRTAASYADGQWRVLMLAKRPPDTVAVTPIAVHAWDGAAGETGIWMSSSPWVTLKLR